MHVIQVQACRGQGAFVTVKAHGPGNAARPAVAPGRQRQALAAQVGGAADAGIRADQDGLPFLDPGQADQPAGRAGGTCRQRRHVAAFAKQPGQLVIVVVMAKLAGLLQGRDWQAIGSEFLLKPAELVGQA
ncbi:hypothetical protein D3C79_796140 [compost metagenome]